MFIHINNIFSFSPTSEDKENSNVVTNSKNGTDTTKSENQTFVDPLNANAPKTVPSNQTKTMGNGVATAVKNNDKKDGEDSEHN